MGQLMVNNKYKVTLFHLLDYDSPLFLKKGKQIGDGNFFPSLLFFRPENPSPCRVMKVTLDR
jgi:hypothetical protein